MNSPQCRSLRQLAKAAGVEVSYKTIAGEEQTASPESLRGVLTALGVEASSDASIASALEVVQQRHW